MQNDDVGFVPLGIAECCESVQALSTVPLRDKDLRYKYEITKYCSGYDPIENI